jgi:hypothetical protein
MLTMRNHTLYLLFFFCLFATVLSAQKNNQTIQSTVQETSVSVSPFGFTVFDGWNVGNVRDNGQHSSSSSTDDPTLNGGLNGNNTPNSGTVDSNTCPLMFVNVNYSTLSSCSTSLVVLHYCNQGSRAAHDAYINVALDSFLLLQTASVSPVALSATHYRFNLDTVPAGFCGYIQLQVFVSCDTSLKGQEHCIEAHIMPDTVCSAVIDAPLLSLEGKCKGNKIEFLVHNAGLDISSLQQIKFIIIDDHLLIQGNPHVIQQGILTMSAYSSVAFNIFNVNTTAYKIELRDSLNQLIAFSSVSNCNSSNANLLIEQQYFDSFWNGSPLPFKDTRCMINGSFTAEYSVPTQNYSDDIVAFDASKTTNVTLSEVEPMAEVSFFPNPFVQSTSLQLQNSIDLEWRLRVFNNMGQLVFSRTLLNEKSILLQHAQLGGTGLYYYQIERAGKLFCTGKLVAQ